MEQETGARERLDEIHARMGWTITDEGKARARRRLQQADDERDLDGRAAFLAQLRAPAA